MSHIPFGPRWKLAGTATLAAVFAVACGGGESTNSFTASRIVAFGDETSVIVDRKNDANGYKYSINAAVASNDDAVVCSAAPIWIQTVASIYGLVFPECNTATPPAVAPRSRIRAAFGARAADLGAQINAQQADVALGNGDLVTVLVGENDVIAEYSQYPVASESTVTAAVEAAGAEVGRQVNRLADTGAKVLIATIPDVGVTPFAAAEKAANADTDRAALLTRLSSRFNASMRGTLVNDGRRIGLVLLDEGISTFARFPAANGFANVTDAACDLTRSSLTPPSVLDCTTNTLVLGASSTNWLWADDRHFAPAGQLFLGNAAVSRARNNPF